MLRIGSGLGCIGRLALFASTIVVAGAAAKADDAACAKFKWPVAEERAWFAKTPLAEAKVGASLPAPPQGAIAVPLAPSSGVKFALPPARKAKGETDNGAIVTIAELPRAGRYQVTLSAEAWIDVIQGGAPVASVDFSGVKDCPGVRKSVRFDLKPGPVVVQLSGAAGPSVLLAMRPSE